MRIDFDTILGLLFFVVFVVLPLISRARRGPGTPGQPPGTPGQPPRPGAPGLPGQGMPGRSAQGGQAAPRQMLGQPTAQSVPRPGSPMATLEEIRRRVMEAQEREEAARRMRESGQAAQRPGQAQASTSQTPTGARPLGGSLVSAPPSSLGGSQPRPTIAGNLPGRPQQVGRPLVQDAQGAQRARELLLESFTNVPSGGLGREGPPPGVVRPTVQPRTRSTIAAVAAAEAAAYKQRPQGALRSRLGSPALVELSREGILRGLLWHEVLSEPVAKRLRRTRSRPR